MKLKELIEGYEKEAQVIDNKMYEAYQLERSDDVLYNQGKLMVLQDVIRELKLTLRETK